MSQVLAGYLYLIAAVFNFDEEAYGTRLDFAGLGLDGDSAYRVFDFWNEEYAGTFRGSFLCSVPPMACRVYRLSRARSHPWLLGTDLHLQQGAVEVTSLAWDEATMTLSGTATRPAGERGHLFFLLPRMVKLVDYEGANLMKDVRDMNVVVGYPVSFAREKESFALRFERMDTAYVSRRGWLPYATEEEFIRHFEHHRRPGDTRVLA